jgi:hypothetical protein
MKKLLLPLFLIPTLVFSQWRSLPEKKDNAVRVSNVNFRQAVRTLIDHNYRIEQIDSNYQIIRVYVDENVTMHIRFDTAGKMVVTGDFYIQGNMFAQHTPIMWYKAKMNRALWDRMMKYVNLFTEVEYGKL